MARRRHRGQYPDHDGKRAEVGKAAQRVRRDREPALRQGVRRGHQLLQVNVCRKLVCDKFGREELRDAEDLRPGHACDMERRGDHDQMWEGQEGGE